jgi:sulfate-transporting ATPase
LSDEATAALDVFKLAGNSGDRASTLSFGQRRLLGVARVIAARPGIVLLDEPAAGVSSEEAQELAHVLRLLAEHWGLGIVLIEHNVALIRSVCDRVVVLDKQVIAEGDPEEALAQEVVEEAFLGGSSARQTADGRDGAGVEITAGGRK